MFGYEGLEFQWTGHDGFRITDLKNKRIIYIDPFQLSKRHKTKDADIVLVSHDHFDHLSIEDLTEIVNSNTEIVAAKECLGKLQDLPAGRITTLNPGERASPRGLVVEAIRAYNTNKKFHPKEDNKIGFVITVDGHRIYHSGDTDIIPEMSGLNPDIALLPVSGTYVMTADEAARANDEFIKPRKFAIPMHYGSIVGSEEDANKFKTAVRTCEVRILNKE
ncbi:MAG TPA: MBL fold metallo-hydrolase [Nitrososphaeraceae archaeon]|jgi:L-ascorbate metabolism protein UlaG (beta-lactamase superfamily)|nr:MBL fold metallo-hydrolase [Nitrososphaeraceae archaeon]